MTEPLAWNDLTEAAAWLAGRTGETWTPRRTLDAALSASLLPLDDGAFVARDPLTLTSAPPPVGMFHRLRTWPMLEQSAPDASPAIVERPDKSPRLTCVRLRYTKVRDLISAGWCEVRRAWRDPVTCSDEDFIPTYDEATAPYIVKAEACGFWREDLLALAGYIERMRPAQAALETPPAPASEAESQRVRQERRYQMCVDADLPMPTDDYARLPRGIGALAKREGITRQAFAEDVKAHIRSLNGR
jgi:hypothetical protein